LSCIWGRRRAGLQVSLISLAVLFGVFRGRLCFVGIKQP